MKKPFEYYGIFLPRREREILLSLYGKFIPEGWDEYADHCTLIHRSMPEAEHIPEDILNLFLGKRVEFDIIGWGKSDVAVALKVDLPSFNKVAHITLAVAPRHRPVEANQIQKWYNKIDPLPIIGYFDVRKKHE